MTTPVGRALDVGCGTGQSTVVLRDSASTVVGSDISLAMLQEAPRVAGVSHILAAAERLPFVDGSFDLLTVSGAFHWFDRARFLTEAHHVLRPDGWLVIYSNAFRAEMRQNPAFRPWMRDHYAPRYPRPPQHSSSPTDDEAQAYGFRVHTRETYTNDVVFTPDELVDYLSTHSNVIAAVEQGSERIEDVRAWLASELTPLFPTPTGTFLFGGPIVFLQRQAN